MATINSLFLKLETLEQIVSTLKQKKETGVELTIVVNDAVNPYGQNVVAYVFQTKEQRDAKMPKFYVGNGRTVWTNWESVLPPQKKGGGGPIPPPTQVPNNDLPF